MNSKSNWLLLLIFNTIPLFLTAQNYIGWTDNEIKNYSTLNKLASYVSGKEKVDISKDRLFREFISFDYVLNDTLQSRKNERIEIFDTLFYYFRHTIDSIGIENLDVKPLRFYEGYEIYEPFNTELKNLVPNVFVYFDKRDKSNPLGTLLFDGETNKLLAWILLNQGGYHYFLTFNLL